MGLDLAPTWILSFFAACAVGGLVGFLLSKLIDFEFGLGVGLLIPGIVSLFFTVQFASGYLSLRDDPSQASELFGGAIASMLFGTFPSSAGLFFLLGWLIDQWPRKRSREPAERAQKSSRLVTVANLLMLGGLFGAGLWNGPVAEQIAIAFGVASIALWIYVADGVRMRRDPKWTLGAAVLAINFSAWVLALWLLMGRDSRW